MKNRFTSGSISRTSRTGLVLVAVSLLLSLIPFQGKNLTTSKEKTSAQTEVVVKSRVSQKRAFVFSYVSAGTPTSVAGPLSYSLGRIHSFQSELVIRNLRKHVIPDRQHPQLNSIFVAETEDHIA